MAMTRHPEPLLSESDIAPRRAASSNPALTFVENGRAPESEIARWQDRLDPV